MQVDNNGEVDIVTAKEFDRSSDREQLLFILIKDWLVEWLD
jgi:hypothetical protein